jgi:large subunit ribosomal protein L22
LEEIMEAKAVGRYLRVTPRKARLVLDAVRGKSTVEALAILKFTPNEAARYIEKVLNSAVANAEANYAMDREVLRIVRAYADTGPTLKRIQPRAMGRAYRIIKRMSHITLIVAEDERLKQVAAAKPKAGGRRATRRGKEAAAPAEAKTTRRTAKAEAKVEQPAEQTSAAEAPGESSGAEADQKD